MSIDNKISDDDYVYSVDVGNHRDKAYKSANNAIRLVLETLIPYKFLISSRGKFPLEFFCLSVSKYNLIQIL